MFQAAVKTCLFCIYWHHSHCWCAVQIHDTYLLTYLGPTCMLSVNW